MDTTNRIICRIEPGSFADWTVKAHLDSSKCAIEARQAWMKARGIAGYEAGRGRVVFKIKGTPPKGWRGHAMGEYVFDLRTPEGRALREEFRKLPKIPALFEFSCAMKYGPIFVYDDHAMHYAVPRHAGGEWFVDLYRPEDTAGLCEPLPNLPAGLTPCPWSEFMKLREEDEAKERAKA